MSLERLALLYSKENRLPEADALYKRALESMQKVIGPEHPFVATVMQDYADLLWKENRWLDALQMRVRAAMILSREKR